MDRSLCAGVGGIAGAAIASDAVTLQSGTRLELEFERPLLSEPRQ